MSNKIGILLVAWALTVWTVVAEPLQVCATLPDFGDIAQFIGGEDVEVTVFVKGHDNPHFLEARPSFIFALSKADLLVLNGLELEIGWLPPVIKGARNGNIRPSGSGYLDLGLGVRPKHDHGHDATQGALDRSHGDVHPSGNPHYAIDPVYGLRAGELITARLCELRPERAEAFRQRHKKWAQSLTAAMVGTTLAGKYDAAKLAQLYEHNRLDDFLQQTGEQTTLGGWLQKLRPYAGQKVVVDHSAYLYLTERYRLETVASLEPKPGVTPTTRHLREVVAAMQREGVQVILTTGYSPSRYAEFVAKKTGARIVNLAHQVGSQSGAETYEKACAYNVDAICVGFKR